MEVRRRSKLNLGMLILLIIYLLLSVGGLLLFKKGTQLGTGFEIVKGNINININFMVLVGLAFYVFSFILYMFLVSKYDLSYISPISMGLAQVMTLVGAVIFIKEEINLPQLVGIGLIIFGIILANWKK